ncbi:MAG: hypothetical protein R2827_00855 [Bdellovibrionales bacterium]
MGSIRSICTSARRAAWARKQLHYLKYAPLHPEVLEAELFWLIELEYALEYTMCLELRDFVLRRVPVFLSLPDNGRDFYLRVGRDHYSSPEQETGVHL